MLLENSKKFQMHYSSVLGKWLLYAGKRTPETVCCVLFFVKTLMKHNKLLQKKKRKETHRSNGKHSVTWARETTQLIVWETTSDCHNQGKVTLLGELMKIQRNEKGNEKDWISDNFKRAETSCWCLIVSHWSWFLTFFTFATSFPHFEHAKHMQESIHHSRSEHFFLVKPNNREKIFRFSEQKEREGVGRRGRRNRRNKI